MSQLICTGCLRRTAGERQSCAGGTAVGSPSARSRIASLEKTEENTEYGIFSEGDRWVDGPFYGSEGEWVAQERARLYEEDWGNPVFSYLVLEVCPGHHLQPKKSCPGCGSNESRVSG